MTARLGLGLAALGRPGYVTLNHATDLGGRYDPAIMELHAHEVLDAAFDAGIRYIDAARSYGRAEDFVASWLRKRKIEPGEVVVASKWGYTYTAGWSTSAAQHEVKDHSIVAFERQLAESLERIREVADDRGTTIEQLALAAALARPWADFVLTGAATVEQIQSSAAASDLVYDTELEEQLRSVSISSDEYWRARSSFSWN